MVALQIISKILSTQDLSIVNDNMLTVDYFQGYEEEFNFLLQHYEKYGNIPDKATFIAKFPNIELVEVTESDKYLLDTVREEYLYNKTVPIIQQAANLLSSDSNIAAEYLIREMRNLQPNYQLGGTDIIAGARDRYQQFEERKNHQKDWYFTCGFEELDDLIHGISREEELITIFARINQGKSWVLEKMCVHVWELGFNVGYISPEMSASSIGYRFDTLHKNFSNKGLMWGNNTTNESEYADYVDDLAQKQNRFIVSTPNDFDKRVTVSKLRNWIKQYKLDMIAIDGITYLTDERAHRNDNKSVTLTNISEDLMLLSMEMKVPVLVVVQANRQGVREDETSDMPDLENIKDSDGIAANASKCLAVRQTKEGVLTIQVKKQRFGAVGGKLQYSWNIDTGEFTYLPSNDDAGPKMRTQKKIDDIKKKLETKEDVF